MKEQQREFLAISIFHEKLCWHRVIAEVIYPFVHENKDVIGYIINLNVERGENVRLTLITEKEKARQIAIQADRFIREYLGNNPSSFKKNLLPNKGLFLNFESDTLHYGVFNPFEFETNFHPSIQFLLDLTQIVIRTFQTYGKNTLNNYLEIMLQLFSVFGQIIPDGNQQSIEIFDSLLAEEYQKINRITLAKVISVNDENFKNNRAALVELISLNSYETSSDGILCLWRNTLSNHKRKTNQFKSCTSAEKKDMIVLLCEIFAFKNKISAFYLFRETIFYIQNPHI